MRGNDSFMSGEVQTIAFWRGVLPHWEVEDGRYFVTLHLAGCLLRRVAADLTRLLRDIGPRDYRQNARRYFREIEKRLDANHGEARLRTPEVAAYLAETMLHYENLGYWHIASYVIMPHHVHLLFKAGRLGMGDVMRRFKTCTAREANRVLGRGGQRFWQKEWFDHWSRSPREDDRIVSYIRNNPVRAGLVKDFREWPWIK